MTSTATVLLAPATGVLGTTESTTVLSVWMDDDIVGKLPCLLTRSTHMPISSCLSRCGGSPLSSAIIRWAVSGSHAGVSAAVIEAGGPECLGFSWMAVLDVRDAEKEAGEGALARRGIRGGGGDGRGVGGRSDGMGLAGTGGGGM